MPREDSTATTPAGPDQTMYHKGGPYRVPVDEGQNLTICQCGRSNTPPFCSGRHKLEQDASLPLKFTAKTTGQIAVCGCGKSRNLPWCDASHGHGSCIDGET
ncbi:MAG: CDGSH iron-sulfur domain-containing protein [Magnetococcales bacterium]|nr:CDGSH iron-sulfur domain-containing protein [Magnetococcales bacterium]